MGIELRIRADSGLLRVTTTGEFSLAEAEKTFLEILDAAVHHKAEKILIDGRTLTGTPASMERFYYGEFGAYSVLAYMKRGLVRALQFAYVLREPVLDPQRFGETVAVNRGMWVRTFDTIEEAERWLGTTSEPAVGPVNEKAQG